jgi:DNA-binding CsgD family transcriptional regulator/catechol 2,3-dioxygenase-like lactoylglutathione lyase family enzyme
MANQRKRGRPAYADLLTPAEWRVVEAVRHGLTNREIATRRSISVDAVKYHVANALLKLGLANRRDLRNWDGVARASALAATASDMSEPVRIGAVGQIARRVKDIGAAQRWYGEVLGLRHLYSFGDLSFFDCDGMRLLLCKNDAGGSDDSILYFRVPDIRAAHAALKSRGIVFVNAPHMIHRHESGTEEWMAFFKDNEDRPLAIMAQVTPSDSS